MFSPSEEFLESYHQKMVEQAKTNHLLKQRGMNKPNVQERLLNKAGESLISLGITLKSWSHVQGKYQEIPHYDFSQGH